MNNAETACYIGKLPCGSAVAAMVESDNTKADVAAEIASWVKDGLTIHRGTVADVRASLFKPCGDPACAKCNKATP